MTPHRVVQWATGNTGQRALREVIRHPSLDLVGPWCTTRPKTASTRASSAAKARPASGHDRPRGDPGAGRPTAVVYMPRATGRGQTRAGLTEDELVDDVVALLGSGTNIVTTCSDLFARGVRLSDENRARVLEACGGQHVGLGQRE